MAIVERMPGKHIQRHLRLQHGVSMVEVLVTLIVLSIGALGVAGTQLVAMRDNQSAMLRSQAVILGYDLFDRMRSNPGADYNLALGAPAPTGSSTADLDLDDWLSNGAAALPAGQGGVSCASSHCSVTLEWADGSNGDAPAQVVIAGAT